MFTLEGSRATRRVLAESGTPNMEQIAGPEAKGELDQFSCLVFTLVELGTGSLDSTVHLHVKIQMPMISFSIFQSSRTGRGVHVPQSLTSNSVAVLSPFGFLAVWLKTIYFDGLITLRS